MNVKFAIKFAFDNLNANGPDQRQLLSADKLLEIVNKFLGQTKLEEGKENMEGLHCGDTKLNLQLLHQVLSSYKPDLNIICKDKETIPSYKLFLGLLNSSLGELFLNADFLKEPVTTIVVPCHSGEMKHFLEDAINGSETSSDMNELFSTTPNLPPLLYPDVILRDGKTDNDDYDRSFDVKGEIEDNDEDESDTKPPIVMTFPKRYVDSDPKSKSPRKGVGVYTNCDICGKSCVDIKRHKQRKHGVPVVDIVKCEVCGEECKGNRISKHMKEYHGDESGFSSSVSSQPSTVMCPKCGKEVGSKWIAKHTCAVPKPSTVVCPKCGKEFDVKEYRRTQHKFNCLGGSTKQCETCGREFTTNSSYQFHIKTHLQRNFMCDKCDYSTTTRDYLYKHMQTHMEVRKLKQCPICGKGGIIHLATHIQRVHELDDVKSKCEICGKEFDSKHKLSKHKQNVHKERKLQQQQQQQQRQQQQQQQSVPTFGGIQQMLPS